jgi:hypothetical protein
MGQERRKSTWSELRHSRCDDQTESCREASHSSHLRRASSTTMGCDLDHFEPARLSSPKEKATPTDWASKVRDVVNNLETKTSRVLQPTQALALIDDVVEGKLAADELAMIHGLPHEWVKTTLGHITRVVGTGPVRSADAGGWYKFKGYEQPYDVAPGFAVAWKQARRPT